MHEKSFVHRDIKAGNICYTAQGAVKLSKYHKNTFTMGEEGKKQMPDRASGS